MVLQSMGSQGIRHDWVTEQQPTNQSEEILHIVEESEDSTADSPVKHFCDCGAAELFDVFWLVDI